LQSTAQWPPHVFLPVNYAAPVLADHYSRQGIRNIPSYELLFPATVFAMFSSWRVTQGIYRYDATLYEEILSTPLKGNIPEQVLQHMPGWCVYIETPGLRAPIREGTLPSLAGVWVWWDWSQDRDEPHELLTLGLHVPTIERQVAVLHLPMVGGTLEDAVAVVVEGWRKAVATSGAVGGPPDNYEELATPMLEKLLSLVLYICSEGADHANADRLTYPTPVRTRRGLRYFPADKPAVWDVGVRLGSALRQARSSCTEEVSADGERSRPRAHVRAPHWHTFLAGEGRTARRVKWLPPIPVNVTNYELLPAVIRPVSGE
jgi:hypothetical protein